MKNLVVLAILTLLGYTNNALSLSLERDENKRVKRLIIDSNRSVQYTYGANGLILSKKFFGFQNKSLHNSSWSVGTPQFNQALLQESLQPISRIPSIETLFNTYFSSEYFQRNVLAPMEASIPPLSNRIQKEGPQNFTQKYSVLFAKSIWTQYFLALNGNVDQTAIDSEAAKVLGQESSPLKAVTLLLQNARSGHQVVTRNQDKRMAPQFIAIQPQTSGEIYPAVSRLIKRIKSCNPYVGNTLNTYLSQGRFMFDSSSAIAQSTNQRSMYVKSRSSEILNNKIFVTSLFLELEKSRRMMSETALKTYSNFQNVKNYFGDSSFNPYTALDGENFDWQRLSTVHEFGHILQENKTNPFSFDLSLIGQLKANCPQNPQDESWIVCDMARLAKEQILDPFTQIVESSATLYAMDALVSCL